jgi:signal transduction histidine kinase
MLKLLLVEDSPQDAELIEEQIRSEGLYAGITRVESKEEFRDALDDGDWDIILTDFVLPEFSALGVLQLVQESGIGVPVILLTGAVPEETAVDFMNKGGADFLLKSSLKRLGGSITNALEKNRAEEALKTSHAQLKALTAKLHSLRELETRRIAREIHDELGQELTAIKIELSRIAEKLDDKREPLAGSLHEAVNLINVTIQSVQRIVTDLRPRLLDELGLDEAICWQIEEFRKHTGIRCRLQGRTVKSSVPSPLATAIYRIVQETLTNVARHARATHVEIDLGTSARELRLTVRDNGRGIKPNELRRVTSLGVVGMRERAEMLGGQFKIRPLPGAGTEVIVTVPLTDNATPAAL